MERVVFGEVAARVVYVPRQLGCLVYVKHIVTMRRLAKLLALRAYGPPSAVMTVADYYKCGIAQLPNRKSKKAVIQVRHCPPELTESPNSHQYWRCLNDTFASKLQNSLIDSLSDEWSVIRNTQFETYNVR
jgi:hypothetical protein